MLNARFHKILILLLLLAFTSQTVAGKTMATAMINCEPGKMAANEMHMDSIMDMTMMNTTAVHKSAMDHSDPAMAHMHHMSETDAPQNPHQQFDCCKTMGHCLFGGCLLAAAGHGILLSLQKINSPTEDFYSSVAPAPLVSSHYRPPIFC